MAIIKCKECGKEVSTTAKSCPGCGAPTKKPSRALLLVAILGVMFLLAPLVSEEADRLITIFAGPGTQAVQSEQPRSSQRQNPDTCDPSQMEILSFNERVETYGSRNQFTRLKLLTEIGNGCSVAAGPQVQITVRDDAGNVIETANVWPHSVNNIPPGGTIAADLGSSVSYSDDNAAYEAHVISVREWRQR